MGKGRGEMIHGQSPSSVTRGVLGTGEAGLMGPQSQAGGVVGSHPLYLISQANKAESHGGVGVRTWRQRDARGQSQRGTGQGADSLCCRKLLYPLWAWVLAEKCLQGSSGQRRDLSRGLGPEQYGGILQK